MCSLFDNILRLYNITYSVDPNPFLFYLLIFVETHHYFIPHELRSNIVLWVMKICFGIAKFIGNEYLMKSLPGYAKAQEFHEMKNILKICTYWYSKVLCITSSIIN